MAQVDYLQIAILLGAAILLIVLQYPLAVNRMKMTEQFTRIVAPCINCDLSLQYPGNPVDKTPDTKYAHGYPVINMQYGAGGVDPSTIADSRKWIYKTVGNRRDPDIKRYIDTFSNPYLDQSMPMSILDKVNTGSQDAPILMGDDKQPVIVYVFPTATPQ